jgi:hypothetical protein
MPLVFVHTVAARRPDHRAGRSVQFVASPFHFEREPIKLVNRQSRGQVGIRIERHLEHETVAAQLDAYRVHAIQRHESRLVSTLHSERVLVTHVHGSIVNPAPADCQLATETGHST